MGAIISCVNHFFINMEYSSHYTLKVQIQIVKKTIKNTVLNGFKALLDIELLKFNYKQEYIKVLLKIKLTKPNLSFFIKNHCSLFFFKNSFFFFFNKFKMAL